VPQVITTAATAALVAVGVPTATASAIAAVAGPLLFNTAVTLGLSALAQAQIPDPEVGKISRRMSRPQRVFAMGLPSRMGPAWEGGQ
jgi:hypothetical protein